MLATLAAAAQAGASVLLLHPFTLLTWLVALVGALDNAGS